MRYWKLLTGIIFVIILTSSIGLDKKKYPSIHKKLKFLGMLDSSSIRYPNKVKPSKAEIDLGKQLFFEKRISKNMNLSCATCHIPEKGYSNGIAFAKGTHGVELTRHVPSIYNLNWKKNYFWDGRAINLKDQLEKVLKNEAEMDLPIDSVVQRLKAIPDYVSKFKQVFPKKGLHKSTFTKAMLSFESSILSYGSRFDKFYAGDTAVFNKQEIDGLELFLGKANCISCHKGANFSNEEFHNVGVITDDLGRQKIDRIGGKKEFEMTPYPFFATYKAFKTPSLRNVEFSAPYFHNGSEATLEDVIDFYNRGGRNKDRTGVAKEIKPLGLTYDERQAIVAFLKTLTSQQNNETEQSKDY